LIALAKSDLASRTPGLAAAAQRNQCLESGLLIVLDLLSFDLGLFLGSTTI
jgi:hypothetical protein